VALEDDATALLVSFARDGVPRSKRVREWPMFDPTKPRVASLGVDVGVVDWPNYAALPLLVEPVAVTAPAPSTRPRD
jgi:hypothetical protein